MKVPLKVDLSGQVAVITGAGGVLCSGFAEVIAACGAAVAVLDIRQDQAQKVVDKINADGGKAIAVQVDCLNMESLEAAHKTVEDKFGKCTILINGAGGNHPKGTTDDEQFDKNVQGIRTFFDVDFTGIRFVFDLNVVAALMTTQVFAKDMLDAPGGNIINIASMSSYRPLTKVPGYSAAKAAVMNFTEWLATYFGKVGIRVNALAPGFFVTTQNRVLLVKDDGNWTPRGEKVIKQTPMGRMGDPSELWGGLLWLLCNEAAGFVTGITLPIDGGFHVYHGV